MNILTNVKNKVTRGLYISIGTALASNTFAGSLIPLSSEQKIKDGTGIDSAIMKLLQGGIIPLFEIILALGLLWKIGSGLWGAYKLYLHERDLSSLKEAMISSVFVGIMGGIVVYLLDNVRNYEFTGAV